MVSLIDEIYKTPQTSEYNKRNRLTEIKNKLVVTSGEGEGGSKIRVGD